MERLLTGSSRGEQKHMSCLRENVIVELHKLIEQYDAGERNIHLKRWWLQSSPIHWSAIDDADTQLIRKINDLHSARADIPNLAHEIVEGAKTVQVELRAFAQWANTDAGTQEMGDARDSVIQKFTALSSAVRDLIVHASARNPIMNSQHIQDVFTWLAHHNPGALKEKIREGDLIPLAPSTTTLLMAVDSFSAVSLQFALPINIQAINSHFQHDFFGSNLAASAHTPPPDKVIGSDRIWNLSRLIHTRQGSCLQVATIIQILHQEQHIPSFFCQGTVCEPSTENEAHAFVVGLYGAHWMLIDSALSVVQKILSVHFIRNKIFIQTTNVNELNGKSTLYTYAL